MKAQSQRPYGPVPTIRDVASRAGVSTMTVSRALNEPDRVRPRTRQCVEQAIAELGYVPHRAARELAGCELKRVGFVYSESGDAVTGELLASLLEEAQHRHVQIVVARHEPRMDALEVAKRLAGSGVSGMLLPPPIGDRFEVLDFLTTARLPTVSVACGNSLHSSSSVTIDDRRAAFAMTGHLLALGHSRIGFVMGDPTRECSMLRLLGYRAALEKAGLPFRKELMVQGFGTFHSGLRAGEALLGLAHPPTAVFASNDEMAAAVIAVAHRQGFALPLELTVCGFGNTPVASAVWPELTTIGQPLDEMARAALSALLLELVPAQKRPPSPQTKILDFALVRRQSDGKPHPLATQAKHSLAG